MKKQRDILFILISGFILTVIWIAATVKHNVDTSTVSKDLQIEVQPIEPNFDLKTLGKIKERHNVDPSFEIGAHIASSSSVSPTPTITITPTGSASVSAR
jgi:hypothetical protein